MAISFQHQTAGEFGARFWARVKAAHRAGDKLAYHYLIWWIWTQVQAAGLTNDQVRVSFNAAFVRSLTLAQWNTLVTTRFIPMKDRYIAWLAENGL